MTDTLKKLKDKKKMIIEPPPTIKFLILQRLSLDVNSKMKTSLNIIFYTKCYQGIIRRRYYLLRIKKLP